MTCATPSSKLPCQNGITRLHDVEPQYDARGKLWAPPREECWPYQLRGVGLIIHVLYSSLLMLLVST